MGICRPHTFRPAANMMKLEYFLLSCVLCVVINFLGTTGLQNVAGSNGQVRDDDLQTLVEKFIKKVKEVLKGNDPYNFKGAGTNSNSYGTLLNVSVSSVIISGIGTMNVTYLSVVENDPDVKLAMNLTFDNFILTGDYFLNLNALTLLKLYGSGQLGTTAPSLNLNVVANLTQDFRLNNTLQFTGLNIDLEVPKNIMFDIKNLLNRPALSAYATLILNDIGSSIFNGNELVQSFLSTYAKSTANSYMMNNQITLDFVKLFIQKFIQ